MKYKIENSEIFSDNRGNLIQFVTNEFLAQNQISFGQIYVITFDKKGVIRGNHYHYNATEIFCVLVGKVEIFLEDIETSEKVDFILNADDIAKQKVIVKEKIAHTLRSISDYAVVMSFSSEQYNPKLNNTYPHVIL